MKNAQILVSLMDVLFLVTLLKHVVMMMFIRTIFFAHAIILNSAVLEISILITKTANVIILNTAVQVMSLLTTKTVNVSQ